MKYGRAFVDGGFRVAMIKEGPVWSHAVYISGTTVKVFKFKGTLKVQPIAGYTRRKLAFTMLRRKNIFGTKMHVTRGARKILEEAKV